MEVSKEPGYRYNKTYLYTSQNLPGAGDEPLGTVELVVNGSKGQLVCKTSECISGLLAANPETKFYAVVSNKSTKEKLCAGELILDAGGHGSFIWEFNTAYSKAEKRVNSPVFYHIGVGAGKDGTECLELGGALMQGTFSLPFEVRDSRIVGFKKEGKAKEPSPNEAWEKNPIIHKVEPFEPSIPNTIWWQISVQPDFRYFRQVDFCPRQKSYKAVF